VYLCVCVCVQGSDAGPGWVELSQQSEVVGDVRRWHARRHGQTCCRYSSPFYFTADEIQSKNLIIFRVIFTGINVCVCQNQSADCFASSLSVTAGCMVFIACQHAMHAECNIVLSILSVSPAPVLCLNKWTYHSYLLMIC